MSERFPESRLGSPPSRAAPAGQASSANLADILERVLDKGIVIAGDIQINLLDIELLTIKLRLLVASVDKAKEMGIDWWENDPSLSSRADGGRQSLAEENRRLRDEIAALRRGTEPREITEAQQTPHVSHESPEVQQERPQRERPARQEAGEPEEPRSQPREPGGERRRGG